MDVDRFPATRESALRRLADFLPASARYSGTRNRVLAGHDDVSRLSAAIRSRLVTEEEVVREVLAIHPFGPVEKFLQEVLWRSYWKGWLELRPQVWSTYRRRVRHLRREAPEPVRRRAAEVAGGRSGVAVMDRFARELLETGYLHNHARMWWASFWIHVEGLPWELGADHFQRHLLDFDPATNTLSWRWVAGLQTPGKTYLVRRSNVERYADPSYLADSAGIERLADDRVGAASVEEHADTRPVPLRELPASPPDSTSTTALWVHDEDGSVEHSLLSKLANPIPLSVMLPAADEADEPGAVVAEWRREAHADAWARAMVHFDPERWENCASGLEDSLAQTLAGLAAEQGFRRLVSSELAVGPLADQRDEIRKALADFDVEWIEVRRPWDATLWPLARKGFFDFWDRIGRRLRKAGEETSVLEALR